MSRLSETSSILNSPKPQIASEAGDRKASQKAKGKQPEKAVSKEAETLTSTHRASLYLDPSKSAFAKVLDERVAKLAASVPSDMEIKPPKASAIVSTFFKDNDADLAALLRKHFEAKNS